MSIVGLDYNLQLLENVLNQLDITLSSLRDALRGADNRTLTDIYDISSGIKAQTDKLTFDTSNRLYINAAVVANPPNFDVALSTRASETTLSGIKSQTDKLLFDASSYLYINAAVVANPPNLDTALSTRASETTLSNFSAKFPSATALGDSLSNPTTTILGAAALGWDGSYWRRVAVDSSSRLKTVVESLPSLPGGSNIIGGVFADYALANSINQQVSTTEVVGSAVDVSRRGRKVIYISNTQDVDVTVTIEASPDGTNWFTVRDNITVPAGGKKFGILSDPHGYIRARAIASTAPSTGSVTVSVFSMF